MCRRRDGRRFVGGDHHARRDALERALDLAVTIEAQQVDPVDWLYQSWAYDAHDVGTTPGFDGDTAAALASIEVPVLVAAPALDLYNPVDAARAAADGIRDARFVALDGDWGHQAATAADAASVRRLDGEIRAFLAAGG